MSTNHPDNPSLNRPDQPGYRAPEPAAEGLRWYIGAMNDALFIINRPPRPSNDDVWPDRPDGPTVILPTHPLTYSGVTEIVEAHNAALRAAAAAWEADR